MAQYKFSTVFEYFYSNMQRTNCFINICEFVSNSIYRHVIYKYYSYKVCDIHSINLCCYDGTIIIRIVSTGLHCKAPNYNIPTKI